MHSAALYDFQVEVLFKGGADAMRRQALLPVAEYPARPADPRAAAAGRGVRHRPLPRLRQAELSAPAGGRRRSEPRVSAPGAARPRRVVVGRPGVGRGGSAAVCRRQLRPRDLRLSVPRAAAAGARARRRRVRARAPPARAPRAGRFVPVRRRAGASMACSSCSRSPITSRTSPTMCATTCGRCSQSVGLRPIGAERAHMSKIMTFDKPA